MIVIVPTRFKSGIVQIEVEVLLVSHHAWYHLLVYYNCFSASNMWGRKKVRYEMK